MKYTTLFLILGLFISLEISSQVAINTDGSDPDINAILDVKSQKKGVLLPSLTEAEIVLIINPANGLLVFNSTANRFFFYIGELGEWRELQMGTDSLLPWETVTNTTTGRVWLDRNLGALQVATSSTDEASYGGLFQWGRLQDGHEERTSNTTDTLSTTDTPNHPNFILNSTPPSDWRNPPNDNLWQGLSGTNNPCPTGFRIPTKTEWDDEIASWGSEDVSGAYNSVLKLPAVGSRRHENGDLVWVGINGNYWSSTIGVTGVHYLGFSPSAASTLSMNPRAHGMAARCIQEE